MHSFHYSPHLGTRIAIHLNLTSSGLWLQDHVNDIDFDYKDYARQRFEQYWLKKPTILASQTAE
jgi:hypothetical protein